MDDPDKIRAKRLARLAGNSSSPSKDVSSSTSTSPLLVNGDGNGNSNAMDIDTKEIQSKQSPKSPSPSLQLMHQQQPQQSNVSEKKNTSYGHAVMTDASWIHDALCRALGIASSSSEVMTEGKYVVVLDDLLVDISCERGCDVDGHVQFISDDIDRIFMSRLTLGQTSSNQPGLFAYLFTVYGRICSIARTASSPSRLAVVNEVKRLAVSYAGMVLQMPDMFPQMAVLAEAGPGPLLDALMLNSGDANALPDGFLADFIECFHEDADVISSVFHPLLVMLSLIMKERTLLNDFLTPLRVLASLVAFPNLCNILVSHPQWLPAAAVSAPEAPTPMRQPLHPAFLSKGALLEKISILGPFLSVGPFPRGATSPIMAEAFPDVMSIRQSDLDSTMISLRNSIHILQHGLHQIVLAVLKPSSSRESMRDYLGIALRLSEDRSRMQYDPRSVSSDNFLMNIGAILLHLSEPFTDIRSSKFSKIDPTYLLRSDARIDPSKETKLVLGEKEMEAWMDSRNHARIQSFRAKQEAEGLVAMSFAEPKLSDNKPNWITECFFMAVYAQHIGFVKSIKEFVNITKSFQETNREFKRVQDALLDMPPGNIRDEAEMQRVQLEKRMKLLAQSRCSFVAYLEDREQLERMLRFYSVVCHWILKVAVENGDMTLPLTKEVPMTFASLPEYFLEDVINFLIRNSYFLIENVGSVDIDEMITMVTIFLNSRIYVKNPGLRNNLIEFLYHLTPDAYRPPGSLSHTNLQDNAAFVTMLERNELAVSHLAIGCVDMYIDAENTSRHDQFFAKFEWRYHNSIVLRNMWTSPVFRQAIINVSNNSEHFVRFVTYLMNDTVFLFDESIDYLLKIGKFNALRDDASQWEALSKAQQDEQLQEFSQSEQQCRSYLPLLNESIFMMQYITSANQEPFLRDEICLLFAANLGGLLARLVGPKCQELKVRDSETQYNFRPRELLGNLLDIYVHMASPRPDGSEAIFARAVAADERSYSAALFSRALNIVRRHLLRPASIADALEACIERFEAALAISTAEEENIGEIPDEFLDPLTCSLMTDPVKLPSGQDMDRKTIVTSLLHDPLNPFNRQPMTADDIVPNTELKAKIEAWLASKRK